MNNDYMYEWIRTEMRGQFGYEILKANAFTDGDQKGERLRLEKLYSNDFLDSLEDMIFRDYLYPLITTIKSNEVVAVSSIYSKSKQPMLFATLNTRNYNVDPFFPVVIPIAGKDVFSFTVPGLPLLLAGSAADIAWAFTGMLVDRTNIEQLEISKYKYFDEDSERWIKVKNVTQQIKVKGEEEFQHQFYWTESGPLVNNPNTDSKVREYIIKWREDEPKVRLLFSQIVDLISNPTSKPELHYPFSGLVVANSEGIHLNIYPPQHACYFVYPDLLGDQRELKSQWASNPRRGFFVVSNRYMSAMNPDGYLDKEIFNSREEVLSETIRKWKDNTQVSLQELVSNIRATTYDPTTKKIAQLLTFVYRKAKFTYFPDESIRKECDQLVALLDKWDFTLDHPLYSSIYKLWYYFMKKFTFSHLTKSELGKDLARYRVITDEYLANQMGLWKDVVSFGECDTHEYHDLVEASVNHTKHNCTCYYNIFKAINETRKFFKESKGLLATELNNFEGKVEWDVLNPEIVTDPKFNDRDIAFGNTYNDNMVFAADLSGEVLFSHGLNTELKDYHHPRRSGETQPDQSAKSKDQPVEDTDL